MTHKKHYNKKGTQKYKILREPMLFIKYWQS